MSAYVPNPGPPTYGDAITGFMQERNKAKAAIAAASSRAESGSPSARAELVRAESEWTHWSTRQRWAEAFLRVHPEMRDEPLSRSCSCPRAGKAPACWLGDEAPYYRLPTTAEAERLRRAAAQRERTHEEIEAAVRARMNQREPGEDG